MVSSECPEREIAPGKVSGAPVIAQYLVRQNDLIVNRDEGLE
jgi:hypothetical protein